MIKNIIFDIGKVLVDFHWRNMYLEHGVPVEYVDRVGQATVLGPNWNEYDKAILTREEIVDLFVKNDPEMEEWIRLSQKDMKGIVTKRDDAVSWITEYKNAGYRVFFLSNYFQQVLDDNSEATEFISLMDGGIFSHRVHLIKPMPEIYKLLMMEYKLRPEECIFIDDNADNIEAACALGIHGILCQNPSQAKEDVARLLCVQKDIS